MQNDSSDSKSSASKIVDDMKKLAMGDTARFLLAFLQVVSKDEF